MKVCFVVSRFPATSHTFISHDVYGLAERGHEVTVLAFGGDSDEVIDLGACPGRLRVVYLPAPATTWRAIAILTFTVGKMLCRGRLPRIPAVLRAALMPTRGGRKAALWMAEFVLQGPFDVVHYQFGNLVAHLDDARWAVCPRTPVIATFRGADVGIPYMDRDKAFFQDVAARCDLLLCVSHDIKRRLLEMAPAAASKCGVQRSAVRWPDVVRRYSLHRDPSDAFHILSVGRLVPKKGFRDAVLAVALFQERVTASVTYTIVGEGPLHPELLMVAAEAGLSECLELTGVLSSSQVHARMAEADVLLAPSITADDGDIEGVPNVVKEAMALGLPVVATDSGGTSEIVVDGETGLLRMEGEIAGLADALEAVLNDPDAAEKRARQARAIVYREFDGRRLLEQLETHYRWVIDARRGNGGAISSDGHRESV